MITYSYRNDDRFVNALRQASECENIKLICLRPNRVPIDPKVDRFFEKNANVIYDYPNCSLALRWNQADSEGYYLIDKNGTILAIDTNLDRIVDELENLGD